MASILSVFYEKLRSSIFVSEVVRSKISLTKKGQEFSGLCPFHGEKTPSFTVNDRKRFYHCFGCGAHGDVIKFESETTGLSYRDASFSLAQRHGIELPTFSKEEVEINNKQDRVFNILKVTCDFYHSNVSNPSIKKILLKRGVNEDTIRQAQIGFTGDIGELINHLKSKNFSTDDIYSTGIITHGNYGKNLEFFRNRIMIPIFSNFGKVIGFGARSLSNEMPKYINSPETIVFKKGESLFGEDVATAAAYKSEYFILVEGYFDVLMLRQNGFKEAVASLGTAITKKQILKLWKVAPEVIICLDGDIAGLRAAQKVIDNIVDIISHEQKISFINLPSKYDPDDLLKEKGADYFSNLIKKRISLSDQILKNSAIDNKFATPEDKTNFENKVMSFAERILDKNLKKNYINYFRNKIWEFFNKKPSFKSDLSNKKNLNQIDSLNAVILAIIVNYFDKLNIDDVTNSLIKITNDSEKFSELSNMILEYINDEEIKKTNLTDLIKNTSFYKEYDVLCAEYKNSISINFDLDKISDALKFYNSKKYLIELTEEFSKVLMSNGSNVESKSKFYMDEINKARTQINYYNSIFFSN